jgi:hypothetical protein
LLVKAIERAIPQKDEARLLDPVPTYQRAQAMDPMARFKTGYDRVAERYFTPVDRGPIPANSYQGQSLSRLRRTIGFADIPLFAAEKSLTTPIEGSLLGDVPGIYTGNSGRHLVDNMLERKGPMYFSPGEYSLGFVRDADKAGSGGLLRVDLDKLPPSVRRGLLITNDSGNSGGIDIYDRRGIRDVNKQFGTYPYTAAPIMPNDRVNREFFVRSKAIPKGSETIALNTPIGWRQLPHKNYEAYTHLPDIAAKMSDDQIGDYIEDMYKGYRKKERIDPINISKPGLTNLAHRFPTEIKPIKHVPRPVVQPIDLPDATKLVNKPNIFSKVFGLLKRFR